MKLFSRWQDRTFEIAGQEVGLRLKAISPLESVDFMATIARVSKLYQPNSHLTVDRAEREAEAAKVLYPDFARAAFERYVRPAPGLADDEGPIITGVQVFERIASPGLCLRVLFELEELAIMTGDLGKGSSSPSTSPVAAGTDASDSAATSTGPAGGTTPSIVPETPAATG